MFKLTNWWSRGTRQPFGPNPTNSLDAFGSERSGTPSHTRSQGQTSTPGGGLRRFSVPLGIGILISTLAISGYLIYKYRPVGVEAATGSLTIESDPAGAEVFAGGVRQGATPLTVSVAPGEHEFELVWGTRRKAVRTVARAGAAVVHHVQFDAPPSASLATTALRIVTEPAKLRVLVDGANLGLSPLVAEVTPGAHTIRVIGVGGTLERSVEVQAGETASVIISAAVAPVQAGPAAGWLTISSPIVLQILEAGAVIGTSQTSKLLLPTGRHDLQLINETLGISERRSVQVNAGATATIRVDVPHAPLSINALPWAEAWVDGRRVGETPIGNHPVTVGPHEVVFRHPELGERRQTVTVTLKAPARVAVDMRKPQ